MKKLLFVLLLAFTASIAGAQDKDKLKKTSTVPQKVHNTFSKHKHHKGYKVKHKHHGVTHKHKVNYKKSSVKSKNK